MKLLRNPTKYLHQFKRRESKIIFSRFPKEVFRNGLELGAGDGYQSNQIAKYVSKLISTDINPDRLKKENMDKIEYLICDAEKIDTYFDKNQFYLVFSSNLLEHLPNPNLMLKGVHKILKDEGITIHVMPNTFWKICNFFFYIPHNLLKFIELITEKNKLRSILKTFRNSENQTKLKEKKKSSGSNVKIEKFQRSRIFRSIIPAPHGVSSNNIKEFFAFRKKKWKKEFKKANFKLISIIKGPVASSYGFRLDFLRKFLEKIGFSSEYIYVAKKEDKISCYDKYF